MRMMKSRARERRRALTGKRSNAEDAVSVYCFCLDTSEDDYHQH
jgi:hypothetical protein